MADPEAAKAAADAASDTGFWAALVALFGTATAYLGRRTGRASREAQLVNETAARVTEIATTTSQAAAQHIVGAVDRLIGELREQRALIDQSRREMHSRIDDLAGDVADARRESAEREARIVRDRGRG